MRLIDELTNFIVHSCWISVKGNPGLLYFGLRRKYHSLFLQHPDVNSDEDYLQPLSLIASPVLGSLASMMEKLHEFSFWWYENGSTALVGSEMAWDMVQRAEIQLQ